MNRERESMPRIQNILTLTLLLCMANSSFAGDLIAEADAFYNLRAQGFNEKTLLADSTNIDKAIPLYIEVIENSSGAVKEEAIWKLVRAYYFKGGYATPDRDTRKAIYDKGKEIAAAGIKEFPESAALHVWMATIWGVWAQEYGTLKAARQGVAGKIKDHCEKAIEIDEKFGEAAAYRVLGRLHYEAPKIPFILGWPSKKKAVKYLEKSYEIAPNNAFTKQFLAEALYKQKQKTRAVKLLEEVLETGDTSLGTVEYTVLKREVIEILREWKKHK